MRTFLLAALVAFAAVVPAPAFAGGDKHGSGERRPASSRARITVNVVHGTDDESGMDPKLSSSLASQLRNFRYKGYRLLDSQSAELAPGSDATFSIEGGRTLTVTLVDKDADHARVRVEMTGKKGTILDTTVKVGRDSTFIVGGPQFKGGTLYLPLKVSY